MKILLIDNHTEHKKALADALSGHEVEVQMYRPGLEFNTAGKDLVILSGGGGEGYEIEDELIEGHLWYKHQMDFVRRYKQPLLGICMGFEVICRAYGSEVEEMTEVIRGKHKLSLTKEGQKSLGRKQIVQHEAHKWRVKRAPQEFKVLAKSPTGPELIAHHSKPMLATQFHPELGGTLTLSKLLTPLTI